MKKALIIKVLICALSFGGVLYAYIYKQNDLTKLRIEVPLVSKEVRALEEENSRLLFEIERFENPKHLMQLAKRPEFSHLKHPTFDEILTLQHRSIFKEIEEVKNNNDIIGHTAPSMIGVIQ